MKHSNISIFVPHVGCPHKCAFCDQRTITGEQSLPHGEDVRAVCEKALREVPSPADTEIAFFGGSFTAIPRDYMTELLGAAGEFVGPGLFRGIRVSTRPDYIDEEVLGILKDCGTVAVELGAQSMSEKVLRANERGHTAGDVIRAAKLIRAAGLELGLQMMIGLYESEEQDEQETFDALMELGPDTLRLYPTVVIKGTRLAELFEKGVYRTKGLDYAVGLCAGFLRTAEERGTRVIKCGLHASEFVERDMAGGYYHPAFRELCEGLIYRREIEKALDKAGITGGRAEVLVEPGSVSKAVGQKKANTEYFARRGIGIKVRASGGVRKYSCLIRTGNG